MALWCIAVLLGASACGASTASTTDRGTASLEAAAWSEGDLRKLDPELRAQVRGGDPGDRLAVKVYFHEMPSDRVLSELALARLGRQAIGQVGYALLRRIAARGDVERIEPLNDVGYAVD